MKALSTFRSRIAPRVPGALGELIDQAVLDTCIDFSDRSGVVRRMVDSFQTTSTAREYDLDPAISQVLRVWCDGTELHPLNDDNAPHWAFVSTVSGQTQPRGHPHYFATVDKDVLSLYPAPDKAYTITMRAVLRPRRSDTQVEDALFEDWVDTIVHGALARLYEMPGEWASPPLYAVHSKQYERGVNEAMLEASRGTTRAQMRITPVHI